MELIKVPFNTLQYNDHNASKFGKVRSVLITAQCTRSAVNNPVQFMINEGDSECLQNLKDYSTFELKKKAAEAAAQHLQFVKSAMLCKFNIFLNFTFMKISLRT